MSIVTAFVAAGVLSLFPVMCAVPRSIPTPVPEADAAPFDPFGALSASCNAVCAQVVAAYPAVEVCLGTQLPADECMVSLRTTWGPVPLACSVRVAIGVALEKLRTGRGTDVDHAVIKAARQWIDAHGIHYAD